MEILYQVMGLTAPYKHDIGSFSRLRRFLSVAPCRDCNGMPEKIDEARYAEGRSKRTRVDSCIEDDRCASGGF